jgi:hypothetical protein
MRLGTLALIGAQPSETSRGAQLPKTCTLIAADGHGLMVTGFGFSGAFGPSLLDLQECREESIRVPRPTSMRPLSRDSASAPA